MIFSEKVCFKVSGKKGVQNGLSKIRLFCVLWKFNAWNFSEVCLNLRQHKDLKLANYFFGRKIASNDCFFLAVFWYKSCFGFLSETILISCELKLFFCFRFIIKITFSIIPSCSAIYFLLQGKKFVQ